MAVQLVRAASLVAAEVANQTCKCLLGRPSTGSNSNSSTKAVGSSTLQGDRDQEACEAELISSSRQFRAVQKISNQMTFQSLYRQNINNSLQLTLCIQLSFVGSGIASAWCVRCGTCSGPNERAVYTAD